MHRSLSISRVVMNTHSLIRCIALTPGIEPTAPRKPPKHLTSVTSCQTDTLQPEPINTITLTYTGHTHRDDL